MKLAILGSGPGGYVAAIRAAQLGAQVTVIEEKSIGGTCLNWGCIPTKILASSAEIFSTSKKAMEFGVEITGNISPNFRKILDRKKRIVDLQAKGIQNLFKMRGIALKEGRGEIASPTEISVTTKDSREILSADRIILATGSRPYELSGFPFNGEQILSTDDVFDMDEIPKSLVIIGAGVTGCEFACIFRQLGADVCLVEKLPRALATEDFEISELFERELKKRAIRLHTNSSVDKIDATGNTLRVLLTNGQELFAEKVLIAAGRTLNSEGIGAERTGIRKGQGGEIVVNKKMETNISGIYAIGDVTGGHLLAHVASAEGLVAAANSMGGDEQIDYSAVPSAIFTSPEIASVGIREQKAIEMGIQISTGHFQFRGLARAHIMGQIEGMIKVISEKATDRVLGVHIMGPHASDLIHEAVLAVSQRLTITDISRIIHAHPTLSEVFQEAVADVHGQAIHSPKK